MNTFNLVTVINNQVGITMRKFMLSRQGRFKLFWKVTELSMARHSTLLFEIGKTFYSR